MLDGFSFTWKHFFHVAIPSVLLVLMSVFIFRFNTYAVARTWDGGGTDGTCGGVAGDGNKWSCAANWVGDVMPTAADIVTFDATSIKNATIDAGFGGTLTGITVAATYSGTITQARSLTVSGAFSQAAGAFVGSGDSLTVNGTSTFSGGTFDGGTGTHAYGTTVYSGATFTKASGAVTYNAYFTLSGGTYTSTSGVTTFNGLNCCGATISQTAGTFNHNNGSWVLKTDTNGSVYNSASTLTFYDLTFSTSPGGYWPLNGDTISIVHNLTLSDATINSGTLSVGTNTGALDRTVTVGSGFDGGSALIDVSGTDPIAITFPIDSDANSGSPAFKLNNTFATVAYSGTSGNAEFEGAVTITSGTFECPTGGFGCQFESTLTMNGGTFNANDSAVTVTSTSTFSSGTFNGGTGTHTYTGAVTYSGATFSKTSGAVNYNNDFALSAGTYTATPDTTTKGCSGSGADFVHSGTAVFNHNNGSWVFAGTLSVRGTYNSASTLTFYDLTLNPTTTIGWTLNNKTVSVIHNLALTNGDLRLGTINLGTNTGVVGRTLTQAAGFDGSDGSGIVSVTGTDAIAIMFTADADAVTGMSGFTLNNVNATVTNSGSTGNMEFEGGVIVTAGTFECPTAGPGCQFELALTVNGGTFNANSAALTVTGASTFSSGTFNGGTGTHTYTGAVTYSGATFSKTSGTVDYRNFALSAGTYTATSDTTTVAGTGASIGFVHSGTPTFNHSNGSWIFTGASGGGSDLYNSASTLTFYDLTFNPTTTVGWSLSSDTISVIHNLTLTNGTLNSGTVTVGTNTGAVDRTLTQAAGFDGGNALVQVTGTDAIVVTFTADADSLTGMLAFTLNNANATITNSGATGNMEFESPVIVTAGTFECPTAGPGCQFESTLTMNGGTFNANNAALTVTGAGTFSSGTFNGGTGTHAYTGVMTYSGATFSKTSGAVNYNSTFVLSGSTYTATSSMTTLAGTGYPPGFSQTSGTFNHNNGSWTFAGASGAADGYDSTSSLTFYDVIFNPTATTGWSLSNDTIIVAHTLTLTNGTITSGTLQAQGDVTIASTFDGGTAALTFTGVGNTQTFTLVTAGLFNGNVAVNKSSGAVNLASALTLDAASQTLTVTSGTLDIAGFNLIVNGTSGTVTVAAAGTLKLQGGETTTFNASNPTLSTGSTVEYTGTVGPYTLKPWSYKNLTLNGTATFSAGAATVVAGTLTINPSNILDLAGFNLTGAGTIANTGTLRLQGGETVTMTQDTDSGTMEFNGTGNYTVTPGTLPFTTFYNVSFSGAAGQWKSSTSFGANGSLTVSNGTYTPPAAATVAGDITVSGGTLVSTGTAFTLDGTNQTVDGTFTVASLVKSNSGGNTLTLGAGKTVTVTGATTLSGTSAGSRLILASTTPTLAASLDMQGTKTLQYLSVSDNAAITAAACITGCEQGSNTTNWVFSASIVFTQSSGTTEVTEGVGIDSYTLVLSAQPSLDVTVTLTPSADISLGSSTYTFTTLNWNSAQTVTVTAIDDVLDEPSPESALVSALVSSLDTDFDALAVSDVTVAVTDNDATPSLSIADVSASEADDTVTVTVTMTGQSQSTVSVGYATSSGTAIEETDFTSSTGTLSWATTQTGGKTFAITLTDDLLDEDTETLTTTLSSESNSTISDAVATISITDNDATPTIQWTASTQDADEDVGDVTVTAQLSAVSGRTVTIPFILTGTADLTTDFTASPASPLTITAGSTTSALTIAVVDDTQREQDETVIATIGSPTNATASGTTVHTITITDNESGGGSSTPNTSGFASSITLVSPNGGETYHPDQYVGFVWTAPSRVDFVNLVLVSANGEETILADRIQNLGQYTWTIPFILSGTFRIRVEATDLAIVYASDISDALFTILGKTPVPVPVEVVPIEEPKQDVPIVGEQIKDLPQTAISQVTGLPEEVTPLIWGTFVRSISLSTVYYLDPLSQSRRPIFNWLVLRTYGIKMADIPFVSDVTLQFVPLGTLLFPKAGTVLVKIITDPSVFFLTEEEAGNPFLHWIPSESTAGMFFGKTWARYVLDLPEVLLRLLPHGPPLGIGDTVNLDIMKTREELSNPE